MKFLETRERNLMTAIRGEKQYFDNEQVDYKKVKCFIDLGAYTGDTINDFIERNKGNDVIIYGFEPDAKLFAVAKQNLKKFRNVILINKGTSDFDGEIPIHGKFGTMQSIENNVFDTSETEGIFEICTLDTYFSQSPHIKIDMIKMDIEGAELATIKGAKKIIETEVPILAVCVYHKEDDIITIPEYIYSLECGDKYRLYLRHYSDNQTETVAYFIPR